MSTEFLELVISLTTLLFLAAIWKLRERSQKRALRKKYEEALAGGNEQQIQDAGRAYFGYGKDTLSLADEQMIETI